MNPERWQQVSQIFDAAREREPQERASYLQHACGDDELRREVESLLAAHNHAEGNTNFLNSPAVERAAPLLVEEGAMTGAVVGRYKILRLLGVGGMGEVYLAEDTTLERPVAIKILPGEITNDQDRIRRFVQEAKAASALNHPNILTVHEVGSLDSSRYIVTEYVKGQTLREQLNGERLNLRKVLEVGLQVAAALNAAHEAGIVHRDIKPDNIMVRDDGFVKLLDFGLVKLDEKRKETVESEAEIRAQVRTTPGMIMGTAGYMSPEQARGKATDARTDIFSFGVVLYEMLTGQQPFAGETMSDTIAAILRSEPTSPSEFVSDLPRELERVVGRALRKSPDERYQQIKDLLTDLENVKQELGAAKLERPTAATETTAGKDTVPKNASVRNVSSAEFLVSEIKRRSTGVIVTLAALGVLLFAAAFGFYKLGNRRSSGQTDRRVTTVPGQNMRIQRLTASGKIEGAAISPDGKYVAYVVKDGERQSLWMRLIAANSTSIQVVSPAQINYGGETFSPDGTSLYYVTTDNKNELYGALYQVPVLGGASRRTLTNIASSIAFSPDGSRFAFIRNDEPSSGEDQLIVANADGTNEWKLTARKGAEWFPGFDAGLAWSPDGKLIACAAGSYRGGYHESMIAVEVETGEQREFTTQRWFRAGQVAWLADGSGLLLNATKLGSPFSQIWELSYPRGDVRRVVNDLNDYGGISLAADSRAFVTVQGDWTSNIWTAPSDGVNLARQITSGKLEGGANNLPPAGTTSLAWTPDGRIVYTSMDSGDLNVWIMNQEGTEPKQLTTDPGIDWMPTVSPNGRYIVFVSYRGGLPSLWRMDTDGGNLKQLTDKEDQGPQVSPDSRWIVFISFRSGKLAIWKMPIDGGAPVQLSDKFADGPDISPDGKLVAAFYRNEQPDSRWRMMVIPFDGGPIVKTFELPPTVDVRGGVRWTPDGQVLTYIDTRSSANLWSQPYEGGPPKQITDFKDPGVWQRAWSRDGTHLAFVRGTVNKDVVLIRDFR